MISLHSSPFDHQASLPSIRPIREQLFRVPALPFPPCSVREVPLHPDLVNEPFMNKNIGVRAEIPISNRPFFQFEVVGDSTTCKTGLLTFNIERYNRLRSKHGDVISNVSVVDVYDAYGLEVACSYLRSLYCSQISLEHLDWLYIYLLGSIAVLQPIFATRLSDNECSSPRQHLTIVLFCSVLISELLALDSKQPRMTETIQTHNTVFPIELLAKIFRSRRISKSIARCVENVTEVPTLREGELHILSKRPVTYLQDSLFTLRDYEIRGCWSLLDQDVRFLLRHSKEVEWVHREQDDPVAYSIYDWIAVYNRRGIDGRRIVREMLSELREISIDASTKRTACSWIVQLCYDVNYEVSILSLQQVDLLALLIALVDSALRDLEVRIR